MKTNAPACYRALLGSIRRLLPVVVSLTTVLAGAADSKPAGAAEPKTHTLFMGADISVEYNKAMYRVESVVEGAVVIRIDGKEIKVPADWTKTKLKVDRTLKLTGTSASVQNLQGERAYSPGKDPWENYQKGLVQAEANHAEMASTQRTFQDQRLAMEHQNQPAADPGDAARLARYMDGLVADEKGSSYAAFGQAANRQRTGLEIKGQESFDAMSITFEISTEQTLSDPYVVVMGQFQDKNDKPDTVANWFYARPLDPITSEVRKIRLLKTGFPPGFEARDFQVHLYNRGTEIATDVAPKRVTLTREEAHTYALIEYLGGNKSKSTTAKPFMGKLTKEARAQLSPEQLTQPYYVKVNRDGKPVAAFLDTDCSRPVDEKVGSLVASVRFYPALEKGKAVEGMAELKFNQLNL